VRHHLIQRVEVDGQEVDLALIKEATYTEVADLSGPRFVVRFSDEDRQLKDDYGLIDGATMTVTISDTDGTGGIDIIEDFIIKSTSSPAKGVFAVDSLCKAVDDIKKITTQTVMVNRKMVPVIITKVCGSPVVSDAFPLIDAFHINQGERPSQKLSMLACELGARIYYARGKWYCRSLPDLEAQEPESIDVFYADDSRKDRVILARSEVNTDAVLTDAIQRHFTGWEITRGVISANIHTDLPVEVTRYHTKSTLNSINGYIAPLMSFTGDGDGRYEPCMTVGLKFARSRKGRPYDESVPEKAVITSVSHWYRSQKYQCLFKIGVVKQ